MEKSEFQAALVAGAALSEPVQISDGAKPYTVVPEGYKIADLEHLLDEPTRKRGNFDAHDPNSFVAFFLRHKNESSTIYGTVNPPRLKAVFNDDFGSSEDTAGWKDHTATYKCPFSHQWEEWTSKDGKAQSQTEFAKFIENNLVDIVEPAAADMLEISRTLEAKKKVNFASGIRLTNGETQITYEEEIQGTSAKGSLQIPETFKLGIPVLEGGPGYSVECRLRYRIQDANLVMWFEIIRPHELIEDAVKDVWSHVEKETGATILKGTI